MARTTGFGVKGRRLYACASVVAAAAVTAGSAVGAPTSAARTASLCSVARGVAADIVNSTSMSANSRVTPAQLKTTYTKVAAAEPSLLAAASGRQKADLRSVFTVLNLIKADFQKVNWQPDGILKFVPSLAPKAQRVQPQVRRLRAYFEGTCKIKGV